MSNKRESVGVRCYICDWSFSNKSSLYHPEIAEYGHNSLQVDDEGKTVCGECLKHVKRMIPKDKTPLSKYLLDKDIYNLSIFDEDSDVSEDVYDPIIGQFSGTRKLPIRYE